MKCPICEKDVVLQNKQVGTDENGKPIFNEYAICRDCKKQWNLDKQRAKKMSAKNAATQKKEVATKNVTIQKKEVATKEAVKKAVTKPSVSPNETKKTVTPKKARPVDNRPAKKRPSDVPDNTRPVNVEKKRKQTTQKAPAKQPTEQKYANIPPKQVRTKRETAMRKGYEDMLSTDPSYTPAKNKKADSDHTPKSKQRILNAYDTDEIADLSDEYEPTPRFRVLRILIAILSLAAFGFCVYSGALSGLNDITSGQATSTGMTYVVLAACTIVSALLLLIMQKSNSIIAFILPLLLYFGAGVYAFLQRTADSNFFYYAIAGAVVAIVLLILMIASRGDSDDYDPSEDYDDPFEDDYE